MVNVALEISEVEFKRQERVQAQRRKGQRVNPSKVPAHLTRTSAFAPKRQGLITDSDFAKVYRMPGINMIQMKGRELGSPHRAAVYGACRLHRKEEWVDDSSQEFGKRREYVVHTTWRQLLVEGLEQQAHADNIMRLKCLYEEIMQVNMCVYDYDDEATFERLQRGINPDDHKWEPAPLLRVVADGLRLDDRVEIRFRGWAMDAMLRLNLVSLDAEVQMKLRSEYAKSIWPYIDGRVAHHWIDDDAIGWLMGLDIWSDAQTAQHRRKHREKARLAFDDMVRAGGLNDWHHEVIGKGQRKKHRYHFVRARTAQAASDRNDTACLDQIRIPATLLAEARAAAPGWDIDFLKTRWIGWLRATKKARMKDPLDTFVRFCHTHAESNAL